MNPLIPSLDRLGHPGRSGLRVSPLGLGLEALTLVPAQDMAAGDVESMPAIGGSVEAGGAFIDAACEDREGDLS